MMLGKTNPTIHIPPQWPPSNDPTLNNTSSPNYMHEALSALQHYLPSNSHDLLAQSDNPYSCDDFRMYEFKVRQCTRQRSHDWTECAYAHRGEKARRRDPKKYSYSGTACQDFRKQGWCNKGDACEFAHGVFEFWLHPSRYRTQACKDGAKCGRRVCFFAHKVDQLRVWSNSAESPVMLSRSLGSLQLGVHSPIYGSPRGGVGSLSPGGFCSAPNTPVWSASQMGDRFQSVSEEEPVMERVESGRNLRLRMYERIMGKGSCSDRVYPDPDVG